MDNAIPWIEDTRLNNFKIYITAISIFSASPSQGADIFIDGFEFPLCNIAIPLDSVKPIDAAVAIELCGTVGGSAVVDARYTRANGAPWTHSTQGAITNLFGSNVVPKSGPNMLVLSTGRARDANDVGACGGTSCQGVGTGTAPTGFPQTYEGCALSTNINDDVAFEITLRAPQNAQGFEFDYKFFSFEYPQWVCTSFNDQFVVLMDPPPPGSINGNIAFDAMSVPISVNVGFLDVCTGCALGNSGLVGTGFDVWAGGINDAGGTRWLTSRAPVLGGAEFKLRFIIWDSGDSAFDSTILIDNFRWRFQPTTVGTVPGE